MIVIFDVSLFPNWGLNYGAVMIVESKLSKLLVTLALVVEIELFSPLLPKMTTNPIPTTAMIVIKSATILSIKVPPILFLHIHCLICHLEHKPHKPTDDGKC